MTDRQPCVEPRHQIDGQRLLSRFMLAEFNAIQERTRLLAQNNASRINLFLIVVTGVVVALTVAISLPAVPGMDKRGMPLALGVLLCVGLLVLHHSVNTSIASVRLCRKAGRIRCWFADQALDDLAYLAFLPADDRPGFTDRYWLPRSGELLVEVVNALLACGLVAILLNQIFGQTLVALLVGFLVGPACWILQQTYVEESLDREQRAGAASPETHFPAWNYEEQLATAADD